MTRESEDKRVAAALRAAGLEVTSVFDLVNTSRSYPNAVPLLLELLPTITDRWIKEGAIRALAVREARGVAAPVLVREFEAIGDDNTLKWAIANTLDVVADESVAEDMIRLVSDPAHGKSREMLVLAVGRLTDPRVEGILLRLLDDPVVSGHAVTAIAKRPFESAGRRLSVFLRDERQWVRRQAEKALRKLGRARE